MSKAIVVFSSAFLCLLFVTTSSLRAQGPPPPDFTQGYVWGVFPSYDIFTANADGSDLKRLTDTPGYDASAD